MQPILAHYCQCTYSTPVCYSPAVFSANIACSHCGAISTGINIQGKEAEQANFQQDELSQLFAAHMNLTQAVSQPAPQQQPIHQEEPQHQEQEQAPKAIVYASTHYTHSHHVAPTRSASEPAVRTHIDEPDLISVLLRNSIDPSMLFPSQIDLFQNADDDQRLRLLELWRISPPQGRQGYPSDTDYNMSRQLYDWPPTSIAQEEAMAKLRYERDHEQQARAARQLSASPEVAEPYMASGYDMLARREYEQSAHNDPPSYKQATDPVYNTGDNGLWQPQKNVGSIDDMENQYGAFIYAREYGGSLPQVYDDEMVM